MLRVSLPKVGTYEAWRNHARAFLASETPPEDILWHRGAGGGDLFAATVPTPRAAPQTTVPRDFVALARLAVHHSDPERFARLYALLWALGTRPRLTDDRGDPRVAHLNRLAKEVGRDRHKMHAFVRFRDMGSQTDRRRFAAWFEPSHPILEIGAPFFAKRFGDMDWSIFTPDMTAHFVAGTLTFTDPAPRPDLPDDAAEDLWRTYFRSIFNPARLKPKAMQAEMPKKYWRNMPEAGLIPELIATAESRAREMAEATPTLAPARAEKVAARVAQSQEALTASQDRFHAALDACTRCPLHANATQAVPGEGPTDAPLMFVGEQPGDREDLTGRPFTGPAGQLFDRALASAGIDRTTAYVTNAVKHFKFTPRGKRRLHQAPNREEIAHCRWWLDLERERVRPDLTVALGATALESLTGDRRALLERRGRIEETTDGAPLLVTIHPSYILRLPDPVHKAEEEARFIEDLRAARAHLPT
ncbi:UdgX family uracil-DNA binding protein [Maritimibacter sp. UBA3975]|uniref:UdgX family uracil-DNA binding protein n=1 Tax=Maritimibacter sp. UBA3975 TaxID=1946833 RepID=UPI000C099672|nr:UdgX family uracil-DNA binding protein [Maritimibacter sp. UBA3975]MAM62847.1 uracil-DNA glycosylase [Maritimibacter sp.]|tara:strand:- start:55 stop:1479 length:1425 start_codon:yes stop_codon:yes gene_type:complete